MQCTILRKNNMETGELDQNAIDALFRKSSVSSVETGGGNVVPIKLGSTKSISGSQMQGLTALVQLFARGVSFRLGALLGAAAKVSMVSVERVLFSDFLGGITLDENYVASWRIEPTNAPCLVYMDTCLVDPVVDLLLGGTGSASLRRQPPDLTEIETSILDSVMQAMCAEFTNAWSSAAIEVRHQQRVLSSYHSQAMPARDNALCLGFEMQVGATQGSLTLLFSSLASDTLLRAVEMQESTHAASRTVKQQLRERALAFRYGITLQLPIVNVSTQAVRGLQPGSILPLPVPTESSSVLLVAGKPMFYAQPVSTGLHKGAYLTQRAVSPAPILHKEEGKAEGQG